MLAACHGNNIKNTLKPRVSGQSTTRTTKSNNKQKLSDVRRREIQYSIYMYLYIGIPTHKWEYLCAQGEATKMRFLPLGLLLIYPSKRVFQFGLKLRQTIIDKIFVTMREHL